MRKTVRPQVSGNLSLSSDVQDFGDQAACDEFFRTDLQFVQAGRKLRAVQHAIEFLEQRGRDAQRQSCIFRRNEDGVGSADPEHGRHDDIRVGDDPHA